MPGHCRRIIAEDGFAPIIPLLEAYAFTSPNVDCRPNFHAIGPPPDCRTQQQNTQYDTEISNPQAGRMEKGIRVLRLVDPDFHAPAWQDSDYNSAKFFRIRRPSAWLFSGWNWVAKMFLCQIIEQNGPP